MSHRDQQCFILANPKDVLFPICALYLFWLCAARLYAIQAVVLSRQEVVRKPKRVSALGSTRITQVTIGGWHCLAVAEGGQAYAWGGNEYGQCGLPPEQRDVKAPTQCVPHLRVVQCAAGGMHSCVLTAAGEIWTWGEPWGDFSMQVDRQPRKIAATGSIAKIACGAFHNLALTQ